MKLIALVDARQILTLAGVAQKKGRFTQEADLDVLEKSCVVFDDKKIHWIGPQKDLAKKFKKVKKVSVRGKTVLPGLIDCHTHSVFAGSRAHEFEQRLRGKSYQEISAAGGGIQSTVRATRETSLKELTRLAQQRVELFRWQGVTTLEIKSGYGLNLLSEIKILQAARKLKGVRVVPTYLGAHAKSPEHADTESQLREMAKALPRIRKLCSRVDVFVEKGFFEKESSREYLRQAQKLGFDITIHADQLSLSGGTELALELRAVSADHVISINDSLVERLAKSETVAVLLPAADLYMRCSYPPARKLLDAGACVALATDFNPGTAPSQDISLVGLLARLQMQMTLPEVIAGFTWNAAKALRLENEIGSLEVGKRSEFAVFDCDWRELFYQPRTYAMALCAAK